jgi:sulfite exporter TauE/SafE
MNTPAMIEKYNQGPVGMMTVFPSGPPVMPKFLGLWFAYCVLIGFFVAYLAAHTIPPHTHYRAVFRIVGAAAFLAYGLGTISNAIWKGQTWSFTIKEVLDGLVYALLTAGTFGWLWPR